MKIYRRPLTIDSKRYSEEVDAVRSSGVHVGKIIEKITIDLGITKAKYDDIRSDTLELYRMAGFAWEHVVAAQLIETELRDRSQLVRPGESFVCTSCGDVFAAGHEQLSPAARHIQRTGHAGIYLTPDAINIEEWALEEWKWTWQSQNKCIKGDPDVATMDHSKWVEDASMETGVWKWPVQAMAYCHALDLRCAFFRVAFANGNYKNMRPSAWSFRLEFTEKEIAANWRMLVNTAKAEGWL